MSQEMPSERASAGDAKMSRLGMGIVGGIVFGALSAGLMLPLEFSDKPAALTAAFVSRFTIGLAIGSAKLRLPDWGSGMAFGLLVSLPDAIISHNWIPIVSFGVFEGLILGLLVARFGVEEPVSAREKPESKSSPTLSSNEPVSDEELAAVESLCHAATQGPWIDRVFSDVAHAVQEGGFRWALPDVKSGKESIFEGEVGLVMIMQGSNETTSHQCPGMKGIVEVSGPDARFIARSRTALPRLAAEVRRLKKLLSDKSSPDHLP